MTTKTRAVTYARQSKARDDGSEASPEAQTRSCREFARSQSWTVVDDFADVGASGYNPSADRPGLAAALAAIARGDADVLVVWKLDRLTRRGVREAVRLVDEITASGGTFVSVREPFFDLSTPIGVAIFGMFAAMAEQESANISARTRGARVELRAVGSASGGQPIFGMRATFEQRDKLRVRLLEPDPTEAPIMRDVVARVLDGESVRSLAGDLNARGIATKRGNQWGVSTLLRVLRSPSIGGFMPKARSGKDDVAMRDGRVEIERDDETGERLHPWEGIVDPATFDRLQDALDARVLPRGKRGKHSAPSLFGGFLMRCAVCEGNMSTDRRAGGGSYRCSRHRNRKASCTGAAVAIEHAESYVVARVFRRLASLDPVANADDAALIAAATERFAGRDDVDAGRRTELRGIIDDARRALDQLDDDRAAGVFEGAAGTARYRRQAAALSKRLDAASADLAAVGAPSDALTPFLDSALLDGFWESIDVSAQREFLALFLDSVDVHKSTRHGGNAKFRGSERLTLRWASSAS